MKITLDLVGDEYSWLAKALLDKIIKLPECEARAKYGTLRDKIQDAMYAAVDDDTTDE